jgi:uncharacterized protein YndB with AHSA1/START domain
MTGAEDFVLTRVVRAPRERVFEAWTDAAHLPVGSVRAPRPLTTTVLLVGSGDETHLTVHQHIAPASAASSDAVARERRAARDGWLEVLARLDDHLTTTMKER